MSRAHARGVIAAFTTLSLFALIVAGIGFFRAGDAATQAAQADRKPRPQGKPIQQSAGTVSLQINLGLKDTKAADWNGDIQLSEGKVLDLSMTGGGPDAKTEESHFTARSVKRRMQVVGPSLHMNIDAPPSATVTVKTDQHGKFDFKLADLAVGKSQSFLGGNASVQRHEGAVRLTGKETEDDYPALAKGPDGTIWLAYVEYHPGSPIITERLDSGNFETLETKGNGDQIVLMRFDGKTWMPPLEVTGPGLDVWRPTVAVDGKGVVWIAWSQQVNGDWEIFERRYTPGKDGAPGSWSETVRVTNAPGTDFHVVSATDSAGTVWLAWQAWRQDNFEIQVSARADGHPWHEPRTISTSKANDWSPAIAADGKGNVYIAWDTYDKGNYDVMLQVIGKETRTIPVAASARFEARPSLACDSAGRLWIAYEEGDEQWGKDYGSEKENAGPIKNLGFACYIHRTIKVKCLADGKLRQPAGDLEHAFAASELTRNKSLPRLMPDAGGGLWLLVRHHKLPTFTGEVWQSFVFHHDGKNWTPARTLNESTNLLDVRPALLPFDKGVLAVYSGDNRVRTNSRDQDDLFATILLPPGPAQSLELVDDVAPPAATVAIVHTNEPADVARMRDARIDMDGKKLHLVRGEFHRHSEYGAHRDQDGMLEDQYRYALDAGALDWMGTGDHDYGFGTEYFWWQLQKTADLFQNPPGFIGVHTYERSVGYPNGHRNVIMPRRGIRSLPHGELPGTAAKGSGDTKRLYAYLKHFGGICASHTSATDMGTDWRDNDPEVEPVVEIYQGCRYNYEQPGAPRAPTKDKQLGGFRPDGFVSLAFDKKYRFGFESSSDHVSTHISYAVVLTDDLSRQGLIDAFKKRHSYAATDNIVVEVRSGGHLMGDSFDSAKRPTLDIHVVAPKPVAKVHVLRDNKYVYTNEPKQAEVKLHYTDNDAVAGKTSFYYVRVELADGNLAWASPMWITYKP